MAIEVGVGSSVLFWVVEATTEEEAYELAVEVCVCDTTLLTVDKREGVGAPLMEAIVGLADPDGGCEEEINPELDLRGDKVLLKVEDCEEDSDKETLRVAVLQLVPLKEPLPEEEAKPEALIDAVITGLSLKNPEGV